MGRDDPGRGVRIDPDEPPEVSEGWMTHGRGVRMDQDEPPEVSEDWMTQGRGVRITRGREVMNG